MFDGNAKESSPEQRKPKIACKSRKPRRSLKLHVTEGMANWPLEARRPAGACNRLPIVDRSRANESVRPCPCPSPSSLHSTFYPVSAIFFHFPYSDHRPRVGQGLGPHFFSYCLQYFYFSFGEAILHFRENDSYH